MEDIILDAAVNPSDTKEVGKVIYKSTKGGCHTKNLTKSEKVKSKSNETPGSQIQVVASWGELGLFIDMLIYQQNAPDGLDLEDDGTQKVVKTVEKDRQQMHKSAKCECWQKTTKKDKKAKSKETIESNHQVGASCTQPGLPLTLLISVAPA
jgi:hypothetical protein